MIKMQIKIDDDKIRREKKYSPEKIQDAIDRFMLGKLNLVKDEDGFYVGGGTGKDFSYFGLAFNTLRKKQWFVDNVKTWLYYNSDASDDPEDFVVEDFRAFCLEQARATA
jgi:hypothetical protein